MGWVGMAFSDGLNGDELYTLSHQLFLLTHLRSEVANRLVYGVLYRTIMSRVKRFSISI